VTQECDMTEENWETTTRGGFRRTGIAQEKSATQMKWRTVGRIHLPVLVKAAWAERLGLPSCPYVIRWRLELPLGSVRVHHWLSSDDPRAFHDHPWWFITFVVRGSYTDHVPDGDDELRAGSVRFRPAHHQHTVFPGPRGAWTVLVTGPKSRAWGFWRDGRFRKANKWFATYGHHPCGDQ
jgi:hypothetical protein